MPGMEPSIIFSTEPTPIMYTMLWYIGVILEGNAKKKDGQSEMLGKITISLPEELVAFADDRAETPHTSRSQVIGMALAAVKARTEEWLAAEGYLFFAEENREFAAASEETGAAAWNNAWLLLAAAKGQDAR